MIRTRSEQNYNAKTDFETRRENQDFGRQNNSMSRPPLESTPLGTNTNNRSTSPIDLIPVGTKMPDPTPLTPPTDLPTDLPEKMEKRTYQGTRIKTHHHHIHRQKNLIRRMIAIPVNRLKKESDKNKKR